MSRVPLSWTEATPSAMCVRVALTKTIALETGLGQIQRRYSFTLNNDTANYSETAKVRYIGYELPITALIFIRLGERAFMNAALGFSADFYPSDAQRDVERGRIYMFRNRWAQLGVIGNLGVEYRTPKSGTFYLGATFPPAFQCALHGGCYLLREQLLPLPCARFVERGLPHRRPAVLLPRGPGETDTEEDEEEKGLSVGMKQHLQLTATSSTTLHLLPSRPNRHSMVQGIPVGQLKLLVQR
jgi:hypothetical protein